MSVSRALDGMTQEPLAMLTAEAPRGGIFNLYLGWEQVIAVRQGLHAALEGTLLAPGTYRASQGGHLAFVPFDDQGMLALQARNGKGRVCALALDASGTWSLLRALAGFLSQNRTLLGQRRADAAMRACVWCGTYAPLEQAILVRRTPADALLTLASLTVMDADVMFCCSVACAEAVQNEMLMQQVGERAGARPTCSGCGHAATWLDPISTWMCDACGATVKGGQA